MGSKDLLAPGRHPQATSGQGCVTASGFFCFLQCFHNMSILSKSTVVLDAFPGECQGVCVQVPRGIKSRDTEVLNVQHS